MIPGAIAGMIAAVAVMLWTGGGKAPSRVRRSHSAPPVGDRAGSAAGLLTLAGVASAAVGGLVGSPGAALLAPFLVIGVGAGARAEATNRRRRGRMRTLPLVVDLLAQTLRSGSPLLSALRSLSPEHRQAIGANDILAAVMAGTPLVQALGSVGEMPPLLRAALVAVERSGTSGAGAVERLADQLRLHSASESAARAQSGQQLASASLMAGIPPVIAVLYGLSDSDAAEFYLHDVAGATVLFLSFGLSALSWFWMRWILVARTGT